MGSGSEFHSAKKRSQDTQVKSVGCIFLPKNILNTLDPILVQSCAHMHICHTGRHSAYCAHTPKSACYCYLVFISGATNPEDLSIKHNIDLSQTPKQYLA